MRWTRRRGFALLELVIVVATIGILTMIGVPRYQEVADSARLRLFEQNCQAVASAMGTYQAGNDGALPPDKAALGEYLVNGWAAVEGRPSGAEYNYDGQAFIAQYTDWTGMKHTFTYPD